MSKLNINDWAEDDRPRERLERLGAASLSNAELLAILIGSGNTEESAVALMQRVMKDCRDNLNTLGKMSIADLTSFKGIGKAKAITILAACELGKRRQRASVGERPKITSAADVYNYMHPIMQDFATEEAWVMLLNQAGRLIKVECVGRGGITETIVDVRVIIREALLCNATVIVFCHNHPSGNATPSQEDRRLTKSMADACRTMRLHLLDHVIIADGAYHSFNDNGEL